jgi:hypothetical protein
VPQLTLRDRSGDSLSAAVVHSQQRIVVAIYVHINPRVRPFRLTT